MPIRHHPAGIVVLKRSHNIRQDRIGDGAEAGGDIRIPTLTAKGCLIFQWDNL